MVVQNTKQHDHQSFLNIAFNCCRKEVVLQQWHYSLTLLTFTIIFLAKVQRWQKSQAPQVRPNWDSNSWPPDLGQYNSSPWDAHLNHWAIRNSYTAKHPFFLKSINITSKISHYIWYLIWTIQWGAEILQCDCYPFIPLWVASWTEQRRCSLTRASELLCVLHRWLSVCSLFV